MIQVSQLRLGILTAFARRRRTYRPRALSVAALVANVVAYTRSAATHFKPWGTAST
jgi:hypothetical protein